MKKILIVSLVAGLTACQNETDSDKNKMAKIDYPDTKKVEQTDTYFGEEVKDPYRWLEDDRSEETAAWVKAENQVTFDYLGQIPFRDDLKKQMEEAWNYEKIGAPFKEGKYTYFFKNDGFKLEYNPCP